MRPHRIIGEMCKVWEVGVKNLFLINGVYSYILPIMLTIGTVTVSINFSFLIYEYMCMVCTMHNAIWLCVYFIPILSWRHATNISQKMESGHKMGTTMVDLSVMVKVAYVHGIWYEVGITPLILVIYLIWILSSFFQI